MMTNSSKDWEVGYGRPPKHSQFKPNQSGNPAGRPKGSKNTATLVRQSLDRKIRVVRDGEEIWMTRREAGVEQQVNKSLKGDTKAFQLVSQLDEGDPLRGTHMTGGVAQAASEIPPEAYDDIVRQFLADLHPDGSTT
jgi:hypothetical protein